MRLARVSYIDLHDSMFSIEQFHMKPDGNESGEVRCALYSKSTGWDIGCRVIGNSIAKNMVVSSFEQLIEPKC